MAKNQPIVVSIEAGVDATLQDLMKLKGDDVLQSAQTIAQAEATFQAGVLAAPPVWAVLALAIVKAIIEKIAAKLVDQWFGDGKSEIDLPDLIEKFAKLIELIVGQKLDERDLRIMSQQAAALQDWFRLYTTTRNEADRAHILTNIRDVAHDLAYQAQPFSYRAVSIYAVAGGLELVAWSLKEERRSLKTRAKTLIEKSATFGPDLEEYNRKRFSQVFRFMSPFYVFLMDNKQIIATNTQDERTANKVRSEFIAQRFSELENNILGPFNLVRNEWKKL
jgi:hypothetical protein